VAAALILSGIPVEQLPEQPLEQEYNMEKSILQIGAEKTGL